MTLPAKLRSRPAVVLAGDRRKRLLTKEMIEGLVPATPAAPVHPNAAGMRNDARQVPAALGS